MSAIFDAGTRDAAHPVVGLGIALRLEAYLVGKARVDSDALRARFDSR